MQVVSRKWLAGGAAACLVATIGLVGLTGAQAPGDAAADEGTLVLIYPTGDRASSSLLLEALAPAEVKVGEEFQYRVKLTNLTRNLILQDVEVTQEPHNGVTVEKSQVVGREQSSDAKAKKNQQAKKGDQQKKNQAKGQQKKANSGSMAGGQKSWKIDRLGPGESRMINVTAVGELEGQGQSCFRVKYEPTLCVATQFVNPQIQLTKSAPELADICRPLEFRYRIKNTGTGMARGLVINDELPEGLVTREGTRKINIAVGDLAGGQERTFDTIVTASKTGEYSSRASASGQDDLRARSAKTTTAVEAANLTLDLQGPSTRFLDQPGTYRVEVRNEGKVAALGAELKVEADSDSRVLRMSRTEPADVMPKNEGNVVTWTLGDLKPGEHRVMSFTTLARNGEKEIIHVATAASACALGADQRETDTFRKEIATEVLTLPALVLEMVDTTDPVNVGDEETYVIVVRNQGTGADSNVDIKAQLPEQFEFISGRGPGGEVKAEGNMVNLGTVSQLDPKEKVEWHLRVKAKQQGDVRMKVELTSDYLDTPVPEFEPTRIINR